ncbi:MAG: glycine cleavage system protein H [Candidatus Bathyarchaeia archaeon]
MADVKGYKFPTALYYWKDHTWAKFEEGGRARVGITDLAQDNAGKLLYIKTRRVGSVVNQGETFGTMEAFKWVGPLKAPLSGTITQINQKLKTKPSLANEDPYGEGWFVVIEPSNIEDEIGKLYHGDVLTDWVKGLLKKLMV